MAPSWRWRSRQGCAGRRRMSIVASRDRIRRRRRRPPERRSALNGRRHPARHPSPPRLSGSRHPTRTARCATDRSGGAAARGAGARLTAPRRNRPRPHSSPRRNPGPRPHSSPRRNPGPRPHSSPQAYRSHRLTRAQPQHHPNRWRCPARARPVTRRIDQDGPAPDDDPRRPVQLPAMWRTGSELRDDLPEIRLGPEFAAGPFDMEPTDALPVEEERE